MMVPLVVCTLASAASSMREPVKAAALSKHLRAASGTVTSATTAVRRLEAAITSLNDAEEGWLPRLRAVDMACDRVISLSAHSRLMNMIVPAQLRARHLQLARSFERAAEGCDDIDYSTGVAIESMAAAIESRTLSDLTAALDDLASALQEIQPFGRNLRAAGQARAAWRFTVLQYASAVGLTPPAWVRALK
jgi:hypothetical protein